MSSASRRLLYVVRVPRQEVFSCGAYRAVISLADRCGDVLLAAVFPPTGNAEGIERLSLNLDIPTFTRTNQFFHFARGSVWGKRNPIIIYYRTPIYTDEINISFLWKGIIKEKGEKRRRLWKDESHFSSPYAIHIIVAVIPSASIFYRKPWHGLTPNVCFFFAISCFVFCVSVCFLFCFLFVCFVLIVFGFVFFFSLWEDMLKNFQIYCLRL